MKKLLLLLLLSLSFGFGFPARTQPENEEPQPTFRLLSASGSYSNLYYETMFQNKPRTLPLSFNQSFSPPLSWPVDGKFIAYRLIPPPPDAPPETPPSRERVLAVDLSSMEDNPIIVVFPNISDLKGPLKGIVIEDNPDRHIRGKIKVVNLSNYPTVVGLGEASHPIALGETKVISFEGGRVMVQVVTNKGGGWKMAFRGERRLASNLRGYLFITDYMEDPDYGPTDFPPPALVKIIFEVSPDSIESP